jgi:hypothetical protein
VISPERGRQCAEEHELLNHIEVSALNQQQVDDAFLRLLEEIQAKGNCEDPPAPITAPKPAEPPSRSCVML